MIKKSYYAGLQLVVIATMLLFSCEKKEDKIIPSQTLVSSVVANSETLRTNFAKALVKAMQEKEVRQFLKKEALQKFDGDHDVVYSLIKNKRLANGKTFEQTLATYTTSDEYIHWAEALPLMTIFVPDLVNFTPETWDVDSQVPDVVLDKSHLSEKKSDKLVAFSADLTHYEIDANKAPSFPVVVIKENERIIAKSKTSTGAKKDVSLIEQKSTITINENTSHSFYFIGDVNPTISSPKSARKARFAELPYHLIWSYGNQLEVQRDWLYYFISPKLGYNKGTLAPMYTEHLRGFKLASTAVLQGISESWTEGNLEFHVLHSFIYRDGNIQTDLKVFYCSVNDLMSSRREGGPITVEYNPNVELIPWDMERYGDEWKFSILEHDPGGATKKTVAAQSTFGYNFEATSAAGGLLAKVGLKFGITGSFQKSKSEEITITAESDQLGDVRFLYDNPVILSTFRDASDTNYDQYITKEVGTGSVFISIEPVQKAYDPRPIPD